MLHSARIQVGTTPVITTGRSWYLRLCRYCGHAILAATAIP